MQKHFCSKYGDVSFNTNGLNRRVVFQLLIFKCNGQVLPSGHYSDQHFFYEQWVVRIEESLPKYMRGTDGPLYGGE